MKQLEVMLDKGEKVKEVCGLHRAVEKTWLSWINRGSERVTSRKPYAIPDDSSYYRNALRLTYR